MPKQFNSWLWPDHTIGKRESRQLREEHNALINEYAKVASREYTEDEKRTIGEALIVMFHLRPDEDVRGRWQTTWGNKTPVGIFEVVTRLGDEIATGEIFKTLNIK